jgi:hypothetical protein
MKIELIGFSSLTPQKMKITAPYQLTAFLILTVNASASVTLIDGFNTTGVVIYPGSSLSGARPTTPVADAVGSTRIVYGEATGGSSSVTVGYSGT